MPVKPKKLMILVPMQSCTFLFQTTGITPIDQIKQGMRLEVQHALQSKWIWIVKIMENVGGRLLLRYEGTDSAAHDFWLFYLNPRLHPIDWGQENSCIFRPPEGRLYK